MDLAQDMITCSRKAKSNLCKTCTDFKCNTEAYDELLAKLG